MPDERPVDKGWAWMVLGAVFLSNTISSINYMCGLFAVHFASTFDKPASVIAIAGALANGTFCFSGPLASVLLGAVGARRGMFISTTITVAGYILSAFMQSWVALCLCFGILCGVSLGVTFILSMIPLGFHFDRYRNLAYGVTSSGVGIGIMVLAPLTTALIEEYTWRGTCFLFAALSMNYYVIALIVDPITYPAPQTKKKNEAAKGKYLESNNSIIYNKQNTEMNVNRQPIARNGTSKFDMLQAKDGHAPYLSLQSLDNKEQIKPTRKHNGKLVLQSNKELDFTSDGAAPKPFSHSRQLYNDVLLHMSSDLMGRSYSSLNIKHAEGSIPKTQDAADSVSNNDGSALHSLKNAFMIFTNVKYCLFCCNIILVCSVIATIYNHLPAYSSAMGNSDTNVSFLLSVIGMSNILIRLLTGLITSTKCNSLIFYISVLSVLSVLFLLAPIYGRYYMGQVFVAMVTGACNCSIVLMSPFIIQFVGLDALGVGFGFIMFMSGIGFLYGPPASGYLFDLCGSFSAIFYFCGISLLLSIVCMLPIPVITRREYKLISQDRS